LVCRFDNQESAFIEGDIEAVLKGKTNDGFLIGGVDTIIIAGLQIDVKPGSDPNSINLGSDGFIPVAILTTATFDAADVDQASLSLEGAVARQKGNSGNIGSFEDVDGDGDLDLVVQFPTADLQLTEADTEAILEGLTLAGTPILGFDSINVVP
jgi:hypothetical protein